ncbi:MAG: VOC family protein [Phycisphaerales bacterium]|nr:VOC family protein [Phycisphaerales bacterium]
MAKKQQVGEIVWRDLTVKDAPRLRKFYSSVVGWQTSEVPMKDAKGAYADYCMNLPGKTAKKPGETVAGVCHARGSNKKVPPQWMMYVKVKSVKASVAKAKKLGGKVVDGPRNAGPMVFCVIKDPAGAVIGLIET